MSQTEGGREARLHADFFAEHRGEFVANDFDDLLIGRKLQQDFGTERLFADVRDDFVDHAQIDVGVEQALRGFAPGRRRGALR